MLDDWAVSRRFSFGQICCDPAALNDCEDDLWSYASWQQVLESNLYSGSVWVAGSTDRLHQGVGSSLDMRLANRHADCNTCYQLI